ncbi:hypothetical protein FACS1894191_6190 [Clostridia bacterium]|nr:hypothetical protein FACS1894191_6190 [Clostridia bacterium]
MKKLKFIIRIVTAILALLTITGVIILIVNPRLSPLDTTTEVISFAIGTTGMIMAVISQLSGYQEEKTTKRMFEEIERLNREADEDDKVDAKFQKKIDKVLEMDEKIYRKITKKHRHR